MLTYLLGVAVALLHSKKSANKSKHVRSLKLERLEDRDTLATAYHSGDFVSFTANVNERSWPVVAQWTFLRTERAGSTGTIGAGPFFGSGREFYFVNCNDGSSGYFVADYLVKVTPPSAPNSPPGAPSPSHVIANALDWTPLIWAGYSGRSIGVAEILNPEYPKSYVVTLSGMQISQPGQAVGLSEAIRAGQNSPDDDYRRNLINVITNKNNVQPGATLYIGGHSLGGMEAQNVVQDLVALGYKVALILTFGSPETILPAASTQYARFMIEGDPIPKVTPLGALLSQSGNPEQTHITWPIMSGYTPHGAYPVAIPLRDYDAFGTLGGKKTLQIGPIQYFDNPKHSFVDHFLESGSPYPVLVLGADSDPTVPPWGPTSPPPQTQPAQVAPTFHVRTPGTAFPLASALVSGTDGAGQAVSGITGFDGSLVLPGASGVWHVAAQMAGFTGDGLLDFSLTANNDCFLYLQPVSQSQPMQVAPTFHVRTQATGDPLAGALVSGTDGAGQAVSGITGPDGSLVMMGAAGTWYLTAQLAGFTGYGSIDFSLTANNDCFLYMEAIPQRPSTPFFAFVPQTFYDGQPHAVVAYVMGDGVYLGGTVSYYDASGQLLAGPPTAAGVYTAVLRYAGDAGHTGCEASRTFEIQRQTPHLELAAFTRSTFDTLPHPVVAAAYGVDGIPLPAQLDYFDIGGNKLDGAPIHGGRYSVQQSYAGSGNYLPATVTGTVIIDRTTVACAVGLPSYEGITFDGVSHTFTGRVVGYNDVSLASRVRYYDANSESWLDDAPLHAGRYWVDVDTSGDEDYAPMSACGMLQIFKATPTFVMTSFWSRVSFDGAGHQFPAQIVGVDGRQLPMNEGFRNVKNFNVFSRQAPVHPGHYWASVWFDGDADYWIAERDSLDLFIEKATPTITLLGGSFVYDGKAHGATIAVTGPQNFNFPTSVRYAGVQNPPVNPGKYDVVARIIGTQDYFGATAKATITILKAAPAVTVIAPASGVVAQPVTITATVTAPAKRAPTGSFVLVDAATKKVIGSAAIKAGRAVISVRFKSAGQRKLLVIYKPAEGAELVYTSAQSMLWEIEIS